MSNRQKVLNEVKRLIELGNLQFPTAKINYNDIEIRFTLYGKSAGRAGIDRITGKQTLWFHPQLMERDINEYIKQTVAHEVAHLYKFLLYPSIGTNHGREFKYIAHKLGNDGSRCHTLDTKGIGRPKQRYEYRCPKCGKTYMLTSYKHNRQQDKSIYSGKYICPKDRARIVWTGNVTVVR
jgi:SprT protein